MGIVDSLLGQAGGLAEFIQKNPQLVSAATSLLSSKEGSIGGSGGLDALIKAFESKGLGEVAQSWISTGPNQEISAKQITDVLGSGTLQEFARHANLPVGDAGGALAKMLPELINQFTPKGELPQSASLESALGSLLKSVIR